MRATFPGTPVRVEGEWYEVRRAERVGPRFVYYLAPWDESFPLRAPRELSAEACRREQARHQEREQRRQASTALTLLTPFVGLLPAERQQRLERELGLPAVRTTLISALVFLMPAMVLSALGLAAEMLPMFATRFPGLAWTGRVLPLSLVMLADSLVRVLHAVAGEPAGSLPVVLAISAWHQARIAVSGGAGAVKLPPAGALVGTRDEVRPLPASAGELAGLEVVSRLPKPHWTLHATPIRHAGRHWAAVTRDQVEVAGERRHRFVLRPYPQETMRAAPVDYAPEEVETLHRQLVIADRQMWVGIGSSLFGFLDAPRQAALARLFTYDPPLETRRSTTLGLALGGLATALALVYVARGAPQLVDFGMLFGGGGVAAESWVRRRRLDRGVISGSVLGVVLRPVVRRLRRGLEA